jgi:adenine-specific DNA-methyltransferase
MRFIGCKKNLLNNIDLFINSKCKNSQVFCDLYAGTGTVSNYFKNKYKIISNDILYFSFCILKGTIELNETPKFEKLVKVINNSDIKKYDDNVSIVIDYLNNINYKDYNGPKFIYNNYSPAGKRMYIQEDNALKIDCIRNTIEKWHLNNLISDLEYYYLIGCMIEDIPSISNISGTYGAFLKTWDVRTYKRYDIKPLEILSNKFENEVFNKDGKELLKEIKGDILYLDPPYNARQYLPNYHLLETVAKYDNPKVKGITGVREYKNEKSNWCIKSTVKQEFEDIVSLANFKYIVLSYNSEGLMSKEDIEVIMKKYGKANTFECVEIPYRRFRSRSVNGKGGVTEYLFFIEKSKKNSKSTPETKIKSNYVKSPLNYTGGKYKLLPNIIKLLPKDIDTFYDIFGGGFNVGANVCAKKIVYNDMNSFLTDILLTFSSLSYEDIIENIESIIKQYDLSEENVEGYNLLRDDYNSNPNSLKLFVLTCYAFNHQIRFNNSKKI